MTHAELGVHRLAQFLHEAVVDSALHQKAVGAHARLQEEEDDRRRYAAALTPRRHTAASPRTCPEFLNLEPMAPATALSTSALSNTMKGAWPPSSMDAFFTVSAAIFSST